MTNEEYIKAIDMRRSRRSYKNKPLDPQIMDVIKEMVDAVNEIADLDFKFIEDATPAFKLFSGKFSMIAVCGKDSQKRVRTVAFTAKVLFCNAFITDSVPAGFPEHITKTRFTK